MAWIEIFIGIALLILGRRLFWLFVGGVGFIAGLAIASYFTQGNSGWLDLGVALAAGLVGVLLAIFIQRSAVWFTGFLAGGFLALALVHYFNLGAWLVSLIAFILGGLLGALLISTMFEWALIILSSLIGSVLITRSLVSSSTMLSLIILGVLFIVGIVAQNLKKRARRP